MSPAHARLSLFSSDDCLGGRFAYSPDINASLAALADSQLAYADSQNEFFHSRCTHAGNRYVDILCWELGEKTGARSSIVRQLLPPSALNTSHRANSWLNIISCDIMKVPDKQALTRLLKVVEDVIYDEYQERHSKSHHAVLKEGGADTYARKKAT